MRARWFAIGLVTLAVGVASCGDKETAPEPAELAGTWNATKVEYVNRTNSSQRVDLVAAGGSATLTLGADRTFRFILAAAGDTPDTTSGTYEVKGDVGDLMVWKIPFDGGELESAFDFTWSGDSMTLAAGANYDFAGDGTPEASDWNMAFRRAP
jgi:hypothetical protein